jgi:ABC-type uncharacterized transport system permease subunit
MLNGVHIFCFTACYAIALALEVSRLVFRSKVRALVILGLMTAGLIAHAMFLYNSAVGTQGSPLSSYRDWLLLAAALLVLAYFYMYLFHAGGNFGVFLLPLVLALIVAAALWANPQPFPQRPASEVWGIIHGTSILLATVSVLIGFAAGLMYLEQDWRLKHKRNPWISLRLPSLEWLQQANGRSLAVSLVMMGIGLLSGIVLNHIQRLQSSEMHWNDPVVLGTWTMFLWLVLQAVFAAAYRPIRQGRKVAYLTLASFGFLVLALAMAMLPQSRHGGARESSRMPGEAYYGGPALRSASRMTVSWSHPTPIPNPQSLIPSPGSRS